MIIFIASCGEGAAGRPEPPNLRAEPPSQLSGGVQVKQRAHCAAPLSVTSTWIAVLVGSLTVYICIAEVRYNTRFLVFWVALKRTRLKEAHRLFPFFKAKEGGKRCLCSLQRLVEHLLLLQSGKVDTTQVILLFLTRSSIHKFLLSTCEWAEAKKHKQVHMFAGWLAWLNTETSWV